MRLFKRAAQYGDLYVGVNSDEFVEEYKGRRPVHTFAKRSLDVVSVACVKGVVRNKDAGRSLLYVLKPDLLVVGSDWIEGEYLEQIGLDHDELVDLDIEVLFIPRTPGVSSTERREELGDDDFHGDSGEPFGTGPFEPDSLESEDADQTA